MKIPVGMIGVGDMGRPMALRLLRAGLDLTVYDVNPAAMAALVNQGAKVATSPREVASSSDLVFACLPSPTISEEVALGDTGVLHGTKIKYYVEMSTMGAPTMERIDAALRARSIAVLDAPVSGGPTGERAGRLTCFVAARKDHFDAATPVIKRLSDRLFHVGDRPGQAQVLKLANNMLNAANLTLAIEMMMMIRHAGVDEALAVEVINASTGRSRATEETFKAQVLTGAFRTGARLSILEKDIRLAIEQAQASNVEHSAAAAVANLWANAAQQGHGHEDLSRIYHFIQNLGQSHESSQ